MFFVFDLLTWDGNDLRTEQLLDRKQELRRLMAKTSPQLAYAVRRSLRLFERGIRIAAWLSMGCGSSPECHNHSASG